MSQNDFNLANQGFPQMRSDMNSALQALASNSSGATAPSTTYAYQWWYDTSSDILKFRNAANSAWINFASFDQGAGTFSILGSVSTLQGLTASVAELNFVDGVTSAIQTQLNAKMSTASYPDLVAIEALSSTGITVRTGSNTYAQRSIVAGDNVIVTNGSGAAGNITISATAVAPSTEQVLSATAGAAAGAVGTYCWVRESSTLSGSLRFGDTFAGSSLRTNGYYSGTALGNAVQYAGGSGGSLAGTWRIMGDSHHPSANVMNQTLALRIS